MPIAPYIPPATLSALPEGIWSGVDGLPVLPYLPGQDIVLSKAPKWSTQVIRTASGRERRTAYWPYPLWQFELQYEVIRHRPTNDELAVLWEFFNTVQGQYSPFLVVDPTDCAIDAASPAQFGIGDGVSTRFQLCRYLRGLAEPVFGAYQPAIYDAGLASTTVTGVSGGAVSFSTPPASGHALTWSGWFYYGCRFLQDDLSFEQMVSHLWKGKAVKFSSLRV